MKCAVEFCDEAAHPDITFCPGHYEAWRASAERVRWEFWLDGARDAVSDGDWVGVTYHYDRTKPELLAAFGKAAQRAFRAEQEAA